MITWPDREKSLMGIKRLDNLIKAIREYQAVGAGHNSFALLSAAMNKSSNTDELIHELEGVLAASVLLDDVAG